MLTLTAWGNAWLEYRVDPASKRWSLRWRGRASKDVTRPGFASLEPVIPFWRRFYAVYALNQRLFLQISRRVHDITDGVEQFDYRILAGGSRSHLVIRFKDGQTHSARFWHPIRGFGAQIDPTYDAIDADADFFFLYLREYLPSQEWRGRFSVTERGLRDAAG